MKLRIKTFMKHISIFLIVCLTALLAACSSVEIDDYKDKQPSISLQSFFNGDLVAYGMLRDRSGRVTRHFTAVLKGEWSGDKGTLDEVFWFDDGERQTRLWTMIKQDNGDYVGTASDVEGAAVIKVRGNAINLAYDLRVPYKDDEIVLTMDDWMYQISPGVVINETIMTKWGFEVGKVTLMIMKTDAANDFAGLVKRFDEKP
jgi:hypothetical protein